MAHVRKQLRDAVVARLTGLVTTGARVFVQEAYEWDEATQLPGLYVRLSEQISGATLALDVIERAYTILVDAFAKPAPATEAVDQLDTIAAEVEVALASALTVGAKSVLLSFIGVEPPAVSGDGDRPVGRLTLTYQTTLCTSASAPDVPL